MAIKIDLVADVKDVIKGTNKIGDALEDLGDDLKDVGKQGEKIDDKVSDAFRSMGAEAKQAGDKIGKEVKDGTDKAGEGLQDMKSEAASTAKETAASFGSIEDAAGALQEVAANAFAAFGPAGLAMGLVAAAGIGLATSALQENADKINANKEKMLDLAQTIRDNGGALTEADYIRNMEEYGYAIQDTKEWFEIFQDTAVSGFDKIRKLANDTSLSTQDIFKGGFGDGKQAEDLLKRVQTELAGLREKKEAVYNLTGSILDPIDQRALTSLEETETLIKDNIQAQRDAYATERTRQQAIAGTTAELGEFITAQEKATDAVKGSITSQLDFMDKQEALTGQLAESNNAWDASTAAGRDNQRAVIDLANGIEDMAKAQIDAGDDVGTVTAKFEAQKEALINQVTPAFGGSKEAARQYIEQILKTPPAVTTKAELTGLADAEAKLRAFINQPRSVPLHIQPDGTAVENYITTNQGRKLYVDVVPRGGVGITN
jgi:hypothetical protein